MKISFTNILKDSLNKFLLFLFLPVFLYGFQTEFPGAEEKDTSRLATLELVEAGLATKKNVPLPFFYLSQGNFLEATQALTPQIKGRYPWLEEYLKGCIEVSTPLVRFESDHFLLFLPEDQVFLKEMALSSLEKAAVHMKKVFGHVPKKKVRVEIYPTKESFSLASTLDMETLKRSGAIGICKFHRLMILTPRGLPTGYRWLDALAHEYNHLLINELSWTKAELWLHEGTARYFDTSWRANPPHFLSPHSKTKLMEASEEERLIEFKRMSPSLVYLKDQEEVSLAFSQVSHAIQFLIKDKGPKKFVRFLRLMRKKSFPQSFQTVYHFSSQEFEKKWQINLSEEKWEKTRGAMSDDIRFEGIDEDTIIGASVKGRVRLGDRMRRKGLYSAALIEYQKALKEEPDNALILLKAARTLLALDKKDQAIPHLRRAIKSNPNYGTPHIELAKLVPPKEALSLLETANAINPFDPEIHRLKSMVYEQLGKPLESRTENKIFQQLK